MFFFVVFFVRSANKTFEFTLPVLLIKANELTFQAFLPFYSERKTYTISSDLPEFYFVTIFAHC